jgi:hypothetical protein
MACKEEVVEIISVDHKLHLLTWLLVYGWGRLRRPPYTFRSTEFVSQVSEQRNRTPRRRQSSRLAALKKTFNRCVEKGINSIHPNHDCYILKLKRTVPRVAVGVSRYPTAF